MNKKLRVFLLIAAATTVAAFSSNLLTRRYYMVTIQQNDAPEFCQSRTRYISRKGRSSAPSTELWGFCGAILTDHGAFHLPESDRWSPFNQSRAALWAALKPGCTVNVAVTGFGARQRPGHPLSNYIPKTIVKILEEPHCKVITG